MAASLRLLFWLIRCRVYDEAADDDTQKWPRSVNLGAGYMISVVAEMYEIHPQTLRMYEREGLLRPSRSEGNTRLYTDEDLERLEFILNLARDLGVNIAGIAIVLQMRERMEEMNRQMQGFVDYVREEMIARVNQQQNPGAGLVPLRRVGLVQVKPAVKGNRKK